MLAYMCYTVVEKLVRERAEWGCGKFSGTFSFSPGALRLPRIEQCCMAAGLLKVDVEWIMGHFGRKKLTSDSHWHVESGAAYPWIIGLVEVSWDMFTEKFYLVGGLEDFFMTFHILGMSSSQLTSIFFREIFKPPVLFYGCTCSRCWCCCWAWFWYVFVFLRVEEERLRHSVQGQTEQMEAPKVNSLTRIIGLYMSMVMKMNIMMLFISSCIWCLNFETSVLFFICQSCCGTLGTFQKPYVHSICIISTQKSMCLFARNNTYVLYIYMYVDIIHLLICRCLNVQMFGSSCGQVLVKPEPEWWSEEACRIATRWAHCAKEFVVVEIGCTNR